MTREVKAPKKIWDNFVEIGEIRKSAAIKFVIATAARDGIKYINIREFYYRKRDLQWIPGRDGITIPVELPLAGGTMVITPFHDFMEAFKVADKAFETLDLYDDANARWYIPREKTDA
jgi:hypothetical protein